MFLDLLVSQMTFWECFVWLQTKLVLPLHSLEWFLISQSGTWSVGIMSLSVTLKFSYIRKMDDRLLIACHYRMIHQEETALKMLTLPGPGRRSLMIHQIQNWLSSFLWLRYTFPMAIMNFSIKSAEANLLFNQSYKKLPMHVLVTSVTPKIYRLQ